MKTLIALIMMQLKDKLDASGKSFKTYFFKQVFAIIRFVAITAIIYFAFYFLEFVGWLSLSKEIPGEALVIIFTLILSLSLVTCTIKIMDSLYFSKDNTFLLTMPASKIQLFLSKMILFYAYELIKNTTFMLPVLIAFGMINTYPVYYYLWLIPCLILITLLIVSISGFMSIFAMGISIFMKKHLWLKTLSASVLIVLMVLLIIKLISLLPDHFNFVESWSTIFWEINAFLKNFSRYAVPFTIVTRFVIGTKKGFDIQVFTHETPIYFLLIMATIVVVLTLTFVLVRPLFFKMASSPFEFKKVYKKKQGENYKLNSFLSFLKKEILLTIRTPLKINTILTVSVSMPVLIFLMNKIYGALETSKMGDKMVIAFNILMITLLATTLSSMLVTSYSEEGGAAYLLKINPNKYIKSLFPKLVFNMFVAVVSIIVSTIIFGHFRHIALGEIIYICLIIILVYLSHAFISAQTDIMNPKTTEFANAGNVLNNPNELKVGLLSYVMSCFLALFTYVNLNENTTNPFIAWRKLLFVGVIMLIISIYLYVIEIKVYFKEK